MRPTIRFAAVLVLGAAAMVAQAACLRCEPILNVKDAAVASQTNKTSSEDQVRAAIIRAGAALGWQIKEEAPGKLVGTLVLRSHTSVVDISYTANSYSIQYRSSINLNEQDGQIHKNYNGWINNLAKGINSQTMLN